MIILGIDPGLARIGYGVLKKANDLSIIASGLITTPADYSLPDRLVMIHREYRKILKKYQPDWVAIEKLFFFKNAKTAFSVGQAWGVLTLTTNQEHRPIIELTPLQIKQSVTGYGQATKNQVEKMLKVILKTRQLPKSDDAVDALACAFSAAQVIKSLKH